MAARARTALWKGKRGCPVALTSWCFEISVSPCWYCTMQQALLAVPACHKRKTKSCLAFGTAWGPREQKKSSAVLRSFCIFARMKKYGLRTLSPAHSRYSEAVFSRLILMVRLHANATLFNLSSFCKSPTYFFLLQQFLVSYFIMVAHVLHVSYTSVVSFCLCANKVNVVSWMNFCLQFSFCSWTAKISC